MGLYFRKSVRAGPFRFNFSGRGIGVSTGIPGFRIGTGPRGAYVHMGRNGVYYRQSLGGGPRRSPASTVPHLAASAPQIPDNTVGPMREIESGSVLAMEDSNSKALLDEIRSKQAIWRIRPIVGWAAVAIVGYLLLNGSPATVTVLWASVVAYGAAHWRDEVKRSVIVVYDLDDTVKKRFEALVNAAANIGAAARVRYIEAQADIRDRKYHAGASLMVKAEKTALRVRQPPIVKTNVDVPCVVVGKQQLVFLPDRLLVFEGKQVGAVSYDALQIDVSVSRFVEREGVPSDARVVGQTWKYVNKTGGPDRRFKDNPQIPIVEYEEISFRSATGLNERLQVSATGRGVTLRNAVTNMNDASVGAPKGLLN